jgi:hypothetical protein
VGYFFWGEEVADYYEAVAAEGVEVGCCHVDRYVMLKYRRESEGEVSRRVAVDIMW